MGRQLKELLPPGERLIARINTQPFILDQGDDATDFPGDEFLLELAVAGRADAIVTHNVRHFAGAERFGVRVMTPREFLRTIEGEGI